MQGILKSAANEHSVKRFVFTSSSTAATDPIPNKEFTIGTDTWNDATIEAAWAPPPYKDDRKSNHSRPEFGEWYGIGSSGILEDVCDQFGFCSQDTQTFKGIYFHHLALFCAQLPPHPLQPGETSDVRGFQDLQSWHSDNCKSYGGWIRRNAEAAMKTRNDSGKYGMWWGASSANDSRGPEQELEPSPLEDATDYRNHGVPRDRTWQDRDQIKVSSQQNVMDLNAEISFLTAQDIGQRDSNDRGRGRTVETQSGGLAVLRALWEIVESRKVREEA